MLLALLALYAFVPAFFCLSWFIDLGAKSYDFPLVQRVAKGVFAGCAAAAFGGAVLVADRALMSVDSVVPVAVTSLLVAPPFAALLWCLYDVDWRPVYGAAIVGALGASRAMPGAPSRSLIVVAFSVAIPIMALALVRERRSVKFRRYVQMLDRACSCCGYKQRAVHELSALGPQGDDAIREYLAQPGARYETRVLEEWRTCRPDEAGEPGASDGTSPQSSVLGAPTSRDE